jgi:FkbM family methyltransferase
LTLLHQIKLGLRQVGLEVNRYTPAHSDDARVCRLLRRLGIDLVADVGANDGGYVRSLRGAGFTGEVISFEPLADAHARLSSAAAGASAWHVMPRMALGDHDHVSSINIAGNSTSSSILPMQSLHSEAAPTSQYVGSQSVEVKRLDGLTEPRLVRAQAIHLKVDTQGYEMQVLLGSTGILPRIRSMQLELSLVSLYDGQALYREVIDWVTGQGFELVGLVPGFVDERTGRMLQMDGIFARSDHE